MGVTGFAFSGRTENRCHVVIAFDIGLLGEIEVATVGLAFPGEGVFQILFGFTSRKSHNLLHSRMFERYRYKESDWFVLTLHETPLYRIF